MNKRKAAKAATKVEDDYLYEEKTAMQMVRETCAERCAADKLHRYHRWEIPNPKSEGTVWKLEEELTVTERQDLADHLSHIAMMALNHICALTGTKGEQVLEHFIKITRPKSAA